VTEEPVDGFTVCYDGDLVVLILSSRYGTGDRYEFDHESALKIGKALVDFASPPASDHRSS
jgi:hypothetical protein